MNTPPAPLPASGWVLYDADCPLCLGSIRRFETILEQRGFQPEPLQSPWVEARLGLPRRELLREMRVLTRDGRLFGGADALLFLAGRIWWTRPLAWIGQLPLCRPLLATLYQRVADHRHCTFATCRIVQGRRHHGTTAFLTLP